jgi:ribokinase
MSPTTPIPTLGVIGPVRLAYGIAADGVVRTAQPGGSGLYAAAGARVWAENVTIVSRATRATLDPLLPALAASAVDPSRIRVIPGDEPDIEFHAVMTGGDSEQGSPSSHFLRLGKAIPKELLGWHASERAESLESHPGELAVRADDLPPASQQWGAAHLTPMAYFSQATLPARLQEMGVRRISLDPTPALMDPAHRMELATVLRSLHVFLPSEEEVLALERPRRSDLWDCAAQLSELGPSLIVIKRGPLGALLWEATTQSRWVVPAYAAVERDRFGAGDAFCGGFIAGLALTGDPVEAALRGAVSASLGIEGFGPLYPLGATPGLAAARLDALRGQVQRG